MECEIHLTAWAIHHKEELLFYFYRNLRTSAMRTNFFLNFVSLHFLSKLKRRIKTGKGYACMFFGEVSRHGIHMDYRM